MSSKRNITYKCPYCDKRFNKENLVIHVGDKHDDMIPQGYSAFRVVFDYVNKKPAGYNGKCIICGNETGWDEAKGKYNRLCNNPECKKKYVKQFEDRMMKSKGVTRISSTAEGQAKMLANRKISGEYKFQDGGIKTYTGTYEKKALEFMDKVMNIKSEDVTTPGPILEYMFEGKKHIYISDIYYAPYNLIIEVKDGGNNPNNRSMPEYRAKQIAKEKWIIKNTDFNYLRLTNNDFSQLLAAFMELKMEMSNDTPERVIRINEGQYIEESNNELSFKSDKDLLEWMKKNIKYSNFTKLKSHDEVLKSKKGSCHDQVMFEYEELKKLGYSPRGLFVMERDKNNQGGTTHSLVYYKKGNKICWFEHAWEGQEGIGEHNSLSDIKNIIKDMYNNYGWGNLRKYGYLEFKSFSIASHKPGESLQQFIDRCFGESINESYIEEISRSGIKSEFLEKGDSCYNLDKWPDQYNILFVTGVSGSGKTTLGIDLAKEFNCGRVELDYIGIYYFKKCKEINAYEKYRSKLQKDCPEAVEFFDLNPPEKYGLRDSWVDVRDIIEDFCNWFVAKFNNNGKPYIINGAYLYEIFDAGFYYDKPLIIKDINIVKTVFRRVWRKFTTDKKDDNFFHNLERAYRALKTGLSKEYRKANKDFKSYRKDMNKNAELVESYIEEKYIGSQPDILYNKEAFDSGEINLCFVTGFSGSGKSTLAHGKESDEVEAYELDDVVWNHRFSDDNLKEYGDLIYSYFKGPGKKYRVRTKEEFKKLFRSTEENSEASNVNGCTKEFIDHVKEFVKYSISYSKSHKNKKYIIEGVYLYMFFEPSYFKDYAFYIKGTSLLKSTKRALKRDWENNKSNGDSLSKRISKANNKISYTMKNIKYDNPLIDKFINYFKDKPETVLSESYVEEGFLKSEPDILYNKEAFDNGDINICFITGLSGSGKSTLAHGQESKTVEVYELDDIFCIKTRFTMANLKEYADLIYSFFNGPGKKYYITFEEYREAKWWTYPEEVYPDFIAYSIDWAKKHKDKKYIIEGVYLFSPRYHDDKVVGLLFEPSYFKDYAFYIKGTSIVKSRIRAAKRDAKDGETKIKRALAPIQNLSNFKVWKYYILDEKLINRFRDYFKDKPETVLKESYIEETSKPKILYHGSHYKLNGYIDPKNKSFEDNNYVFATQDRSFALCYSGNPWYDDIINQSYYNGQLTITEIQKGALDKVFNTDGYIYTIANQDINKFIARTYHTYLCTERVKYSNVEYINNVLDEMINCGIEIYRYPSKPSWWNKINHESYIEESKVSKKYYHVSQSNLNRKTLQPSIPNNYFTKNGYEDNKTKRVYFTDSIDNCLRALSQKCTGMELYVHILDGNYNVYTPSIDEVPDCKVTGEVWVTKPCKVKCIGKIKVTGDRGEDGLPFKYGDKTAELYDWDWEWIEQLSETKDASVIEDDFKKKSGKSFKLIDLNTKEALKYVSDKWRNDKECRLAICKEDDKLAGYIYWNKSGTIAPLEVYKDYRGYGLSETLMKEAIKNGGNKLGVYSDNEVAIRLYKKLGFVETGRKKYKDGDEVIIMELKSSLNESYIEETTNTLSTSQIKSILQKISDKVKADSKPPTGNQNCMLCTWCLEAQLRGYNILPRPVYSPRDIIFKQVPYNIVKNPEKLKIRNKNDVTKQVLGTGNGSRYYVHVNWKGGSGGHEFIIMNINNKVYVLDAQQNEMSDINISVNGLSYFNDINYANSYIIRLDNKELNKDILKYNDNKYIIEWDNVKDPEYMKSDEYLSESKNKSTLDNNFKKKKIDFKYYKLDINDSDAKKYLETNSFCKKYLNYISKNSGEILVDKDNDKLIGYIWVGKSKDKGLITGLDILNDYKGYGLSEILLKDAINDYGAIHLTVDPDNMIAIHLYEKFGFVIVNYYNDNSGEYYYMKLESKLNKKEKEDAEKFKLQNVSEAYTKELGKIQRDPEIIDSYGFISSDGIYNENVKIKGFNKWLRGRSELLILDGDKLYLKKDPKKGYSIPGGGWEKDEDHNLSAIRETNEEARIKVKNVNYVFSYVAYFPPKDWVKEKISKENWWYGEYIELYIGEYDGQYKGKVEKIDQDKAMESGKFYDIKSIYNNLIPVHQEALSDIINEASISNYKFLDIKSNKSKALEYLKANSETKSYAEDTIKNYNGELVTYNDIMIGRILVGDKKDKGFITDFSIDEEHRGNRLGSKLIDDAINKYHGVDLLVDKDNDLAIGIYKRRGFVIVKTYKNQYYMKLESKLKEDTIMMNEAMNALMTGYIPGSVDNPNNTYIVNYMQNNVFSGEDPNEGIAISDNPKLTNLIIRDNDGILKRVDESFLDDKTYKVFIIELSKEEVSNRLSKYMGESVEEGFIYETLTGHKLYTKDQIQFESCLHPIISYNEYMRAFEEICDNYFQAKDKTSVELSKNFIPKEVRFINNSGLMSSKKVYNLNEYINAKSDTNILECLDISIK